VDVVGPVGVVLMRTKRSLVLAIALIAILGCNQEGDRLPPVGERSTRKPANV
jgi:hypothetical protein